MSAVVLIIEQPCFLRGFRSFLEDQENVDFRIPGQASTLQEGLVLATETAPDVVVIDTSANGFDSEQLTEFVESGASKFRVLALGESKQKSPIQQIFATGVKGYLLKSADRDEVVRAVAAVAAGEAYLDPHLLLVVMGVEAPGAEIRVSRTVEPSSKVSGREIAVLKRTAFGYSAKEIASELEISPKSVETYKARAATKLGLVSRSDIIRYANSCGWFSVNHCVS